MQVLHPTESGGGALLYESARLGNLALVNSLLGAKVSASYADEHANTALHHAVIGGHAAVGRPLPQLAQSTPSHRHFIPNERNATAV